MPTTEIDLTAAARRLGELVAAVPDAALGGPTPCPDYTVGDLLDHVGGLAQAFTAAARKATLAEGAGDPAGDAARLPDDWRTRIPADLLALAAAWQEPGAWTGMAEAGGVEMPSEIMGLVALDELVVHGWDVARATGQPYEPDPASLEAVHGFVQGFSGPGQEEARAGLFGPEVPVDDAAPLLDRVVGITGRHPHWSPTD